MKPRRVLEAVLVSGEDKEIDFEVMVTLLEGDGGIWISINELTCAIGCTFEPYNVGRNKRSIEAHFADMLKYPCGWEESKIVIGSEIIADLVVGTSLWKKYKGE
jgi:hypothetical protein